MEIREPSLSLVFPDTQNKPLTHKAILILYKPFYFPPRKNPKPYRGLPSGENASYENRTYCQYVLHLVSFQGIHTI